MAFKLENKEKAVEKKDGNVRAVYQTPGIFDNVRIAEVKQGKSSFKKTPFIQLITVGQNGEIGKSTEMYLSTEVSPGKSMPAWNVTSRNLIDLVVATDPGKSRADLDGLELVPDIKDAQGNPDLEKQYQGLVDIVTDLLVGKPFRAKFKGEEGKNGYIYATMDRVESMSIPRASSRLKFDENYDIKKLSNISPQEATAEPVGDDLPF